MDYVAEFRDHARTLLGFRRAAKPHVLGRKTFAPKTLENAQYLFNREVNREARTYIIAARIVNGILKEAKRERAND